MLSRIRLRGRVPQKLSCAERFPTAWLVLWPSKMARDSPSLSACTLTEGKAFREKTVRTPIVATRLALFRANVVRALASSLHNPRTTAIVVPRREKRRGGMGKINMCERIKKGRWESGFGQWRRQGKE